MMYDVCAIYVAFGLGFVGLLMGVVLRFTVLTEMDTYMSVGQVSWHRAGPRKLSFFPFSMDVIADYGSACAFNAVGNRRYPDVDRASVPHWLRLVFATQFIVMIFGVAAFFGILGYMYWRFEQYR